MQDGDAAPPVPYLGSRMGRSGITGILKGGLRISHHRQTPRAIPRRRSLHGPRAAFPTLGTKISFALHRRLGPEPLAGARDVLGHGRAQPRSRKTDSTLSVAKRSISSARDCKTSAIRRVETLPRHTWITCGGWPRTRARARKSLSFVTMEKPSSFANRQIRSSSTPASPTSRTWQLSGKRGRRISTRRNDRFWSISAFTPPTREAAAHVPPQTPSRPECPRWSVRGSRQ